MRVIDLGDDYEKAKSRFYIFNSAATLGNGPAGIDGLRQLTKVQDAFDAVSDEETSTLEGQTVTTRKLREGVTQIVLEDAPYETLKARFFGAGVPWLAASSRRVVDAYDTFCAAEEVKADDVVRPPAAKQNRRR